MNRPDSNKTASADRILTGIGLAIAEAKMVRSQLGATTDSTRSPRGRE